MKTKRWNRLSLRAKMSIIYLFANVVILTVNLILLSGINGMTERIDRVYQTNRHLNELAVALSDVQNNMTEYLSVKTSDSLEEFYRSEQEFRQMVQELNTRVTDDMFDRMEHNIRNMSEKYLSVAEQTIEAKRGRNVEKYRQRYESAGVLYENILDYIESLNIEQFKQNSEEYSVLIRTFGYFETASVVVIFLVILGNAVLITRLTGTMIQPLMTLAVQADSVAKGNFEVKELPIEAQDEIGVVTRAFNQMVHSIRRYIERIREQMEVERTLKEKELKMEAHLKDAQLKYLQAQINPHFLFNSLNAGAQLAMLEDAERTYRYVQNMADFFRYNVKRGDTLVTIKDELELVDNYIYILNVRFSGEIHYEKEVDESLLQISMPSMILQPIVENCVNHGIREKAGEGRIRLRIYRIDDVVCISIKDNGVGMSQEMIDKILHGWEGEKGSSNASNGIGMDNVIARLRLFQGTDDVATVISEGEGMGTEVILYLQM